MKPRLFSNDTPAVPESGAHARIRDQYPTSSNSPEVFPTLAGKPLDEFWMRNLSQSCSFLMMGNGRFQGWKSFPNRDCCFNDVNFGGILNDSGL
ncbi:hypothetical protein CDAR_280651 [Caerostris darwini]|uniref:Uncharacterized protein n=1 Tax=Caerostris darwini TaxID=1538125 RepID=A0AAV4MDM2_9ARAC|nr:hypothetical protein CDAR_280651 [Caerostris darwini]